MEITRVVTFVPLLPSRPSYLLPLPLGSRGGGSSNDPSTMMYESYTFFVRDIRDVILDSIAWN